MRHGAAGRVLGLLLILGVVLPGPGLEATTVRHQPLGELVDEAQRVFVGVCVSVRDGALPQPGGRSIPYTEYTFDVRDVVKGSVPSTVTFRQFGSREPRPTPDGKFMAVSRVPGMPVYQPGQELLLFLIGDSALGLTSPVGLTQGAFRVVSDGGTRAAVNGFENTGLFLDVHRAASRAGRALSSDEAAMTGVAKGPAPLDSLMSLSRKLVR